MPLVLSTTRFPFFQEDFSNVEYGVNPEELHKIRDDKSNQASQRLLAGVALCHVMYVWSW